MNPSTPARRRTQRLRTGSWRTGAETRREASGRSGLLLSLVTGLLVAATGHAGECSVPSTHASVASAVADLTCDTVLLAAMTYTEDIELERPLILTGPDGGGAVLRGSIEVSDGVGGLLRDLAVETPCGEEAMSIFGLADLSLDGVELRTITDCSLIFESDFESGSLIDWAADRGVSANTAVRSTERPSSPARLQPRGSTDA